MLFSSPATTGAVSGQSCLRLVRRIVHSLRRDDGNVILETALMLPVVFLITFGFIDFSLVIFGIGNANFASRAALRYATLHSSTSYKPTTQQDLNNIMGPFMYRYPSNNWWITSTYYAGNVIGSGVYITVSVTYSFNAFGHIYNGISYTTTGWGSVQQ